MTATDFSQKNLDLDGLQDDLGQVPPKIVPFGTYLQPDDTCTADLQSDFVPLETGDPSKEKTRETEKFHLDRCDSGR